MAIFYASIFFAAAVIHIFLCGAIHRLATRSRHKSLARCLHVLGEIEWVFLLWAVPLAFSIIFLEGVGALTQYLHQVSYVEPLFIVVIMTISATTPILIGVEKLLAVIAKCAGGKPWAWWCSILTFGPLLGSFITEPASITICALLLSKHFYVYEPSRKFAYATLALLFVNVSVGGTLTPFAAPPILVVAREWNWTTPFMLTHFGWKAVVGILLTNALYFWLFRKEFARLKPQQVHPSKFGPTEVPWWIIGTHLMFLGWIVYFGHAPKLFLAGFAVFLIFYRLTLHWQKTWQLKNAILVGCFLLGLMLHAGLQRWWIEPLLQDMQALPLMLLATFLTAFNDNAVITYLGTLVPHLDFSLQYALVAGAVTGGGLTIIANAPNPAGFALLKEYFADGNVSPWFLAMAALPATVIMGLCFTLLGRGI